MEQTLFESWTRVKVNFVEFLDSDSWVFLEFTHD